MKLVFDIGGTHLRLAAVTDDGIGPVSRIDTPKEPEEAIVRLVALTRELAQCGSESLTGGVAAIVDTDGAVVSATNLTNWNGFPFQERLAGVTGVPVTLKNDAELAGLGEAVYGAGKGMQSVAYIGLGTGIGTSRIVNGIVEPHSSDGSMRYGIITLSDDTTLEERIGGAALSRAYHIDSALLPPAVWDEHASLLAEGVANAITAWSPDVVVLGGSLMNEPNGFKLDLVIKEVEKRFPGPLPPIRKALLGDASGLYGARVLAQD